MPWSVQFTDDAWREFCSLPSPDHDDVATELFNEWTEHGPRHTRVHLSRGILLRENALDCGVKIDFTVPMDGKNEVLILKIWPAS